MDEEDKFLPRQLANDGISSRFKIRNDEQKFGKKIKIRSSLHFDKVSSENVDQMKPTNNQCGPHFANAAPVGKKCVGAIVGPSIFLREEFSSNQQQQQHENVNNNNNNSRKSRRLVVRSLSDGAKSVSSNSWPNDPHYHDCFHHYHHNNSNNNESTEKFEGGQRRELELAFGSLSLTTAFKSLSDSKLFCCSKDVKSERRLTFLPSSNDFYLIQTVPMQGNSIKTKVIEGNVDGTKMLFLDEICLNSSLIATEVDDYEEEVMIGRGQLVDDEDEDEYGSVIVLSSDQLKCPTTNGRGSLGSSASLELDSGRASDTGTLGQSSTTSGCSSTSSTSSSTSSSEGVRIVSNSFCDFPGNGGPASSKKKSRCLEEDSSFCSLSPTSTGGSSGASSSSYYYFGERQSLVLFDAEALKANKVSVFVPYSTLLRNKREHPRAERETSVDGEEEEREELEKQKQLLRLRHHHDGDEEDNVFICGDTHVILRINSRDNVINNGIGEASGESLVKGRSGKSKIYSKRMTKRLITAASTSTTSTPLDHNSQGDEVEEGSFVSQENHNNNDDAEKRHQQHRLPRPPPISPKIIVRKCQSVTPPSSSSLEDLRVTSSPAEMSQSSVEKKIVAQKIETNNQMVPPPQKQPVRRKDLCKLLGLNNDSDINGVPEGKVAQKVALLHTAKAVVVQKDDLKTNDRIPASTNEGAEPVKRKNLAKFLGVELVDGTTLTEVETPVERESSKERRPFGKDSLSRSISSVGDGSMSSKGQRSRSKRLLPSYWGHLVRNWRDGANGSTNGDDRDGDNDIEMEVPVQLLQLPSHEGERTNRKDLSKFLGLDDSDGEEIVFIQTKPPQNFRHLQRSNPDEELQRHFEDRQSLSKSRSFSSSSLRLTNSDGHNTIDDFLRTSMRRNKNVPEWLGSLGKASLKRVLKTAAAEEERRLSVSQQSDDFDPPPRKSVLFKEYAFSVQESIATGLPIIPFVCPTTSTFGERKRKKDAAKRTAEILSTKKSNTNANQPHAGTSLEALLRIANEEWMRENSEESGMLDTSLDTSEASSVSVASTVKKAIGPPSSLVTLDRKGQPQPPTRQAVHPRVLEASKTFGSYKSSASTASSSHNNSNNNNNSSSDNMGKKANVQRSSVVFGPTSHRWIPRREAYPEVMVPYPAPFVCRPAQFYAAMPIPQPPNYVPGLPPRMAMYPESGRVKLVRRNPARQVIHSGDYVDMRQGRLLKAMHQPNDHHHHRES